MHAHSHHSDHYQGNAIDINSDFTANARAAAKLIHRFSESIYSSMTWYNWEGITWRWPKREKTTNRFLIDDDELIRVQYGNIVVSMSAYTYRRWWVRAFNQAFVKARSRNDNELAQALYEGFSN
jgi:hypothetical protein